MLENTIQFAVVAFALVVSPGPDTMVILRHSVGGGGRRAGFFAVLGVQAGLVGHIILVVSGLSLIVAADARLLRALAFAGSAYLAWLAAGIVRSPIAVAGANSEIAARAGEPFRQGLFSNLLNPKVIFLFVGLMPNFAGAKSAPPELQFAVLGATLIVINTMYQSALAAFADSVRRFLSDDAKQKTARWILGGALFFFAAVLFVENVLEK